MNHNPAPRVTGSSGMQKQSSGLYDTSFQHRTDTNSYMLFYPQKPIVRTDYLELLNCIEQPAGQIAIVAIACYGGWTSRLCPQKLY